MRYWGKNIEIDGSFYNTAQGRSLSPTEAEKAQLRAAGNFFQFEGDQEMYEVTVQNLMREIAQSTIGWILIGAINRSNNKLRIIPLTSKEQSMLNRIPCANAAGKFKQGGFDSVVWFEPWSRMLSVFTGTGNSPQQVLVHELQHALRMLRGKLFVSGPLGGGAFPNPEELFSTTIENMYLSFAGQTGRMLGAYSQAVPLGGRSAEDWFKAYGNELSVWSSDLPDVSEQFERLVGGWNPFAVRRAVLDRRISL